MKETSTKIHSYMSVKQKSTTILKPNTASIKQNKSCRINTQQIYLTSQHLHSPPAVQEVQDLEAELGIKEP